MTLSNDFYFINLDGFSKVLGGLHSNDGGIEISLSERPLNFDELLKKVTMESLIEGDPKTWFLDGRHITLSAGSRQNVTLLGNLFYRRVNLKPKFERDDGGIIERLSMTFLLPSAITPNNALGRVRTDLKVVYSSDPEGGNANLVGVRRDYRLYRGEFVRTILDSIPDSSLAPNVDLYQPPIDEVRI